jgi:hypothetical protein
MSHVTLIHHRLFFYFTVLNEGVFASLGVLCNSCKKLKHKMKEHIFNYWWMDLIRIEAIIETLLYSFAACIRFALKHKLTPGSPWTEWNVILWLRDRIDFLTHSLCMEYDHLSIHMLIFRDYKRLCMLADV